MTQEELEALPIGAPLSDDPLFNEAFAGSGFSGDDLFGFESRDGYFYRLHEATDGTWFRTKGIL